MDIDIKIHPGTSGNEKIHEAINKNQETNVKFKCMIQDSLGREIYVVQDESGGNERFSDRAVFYCVNIPGENEWVSNSVENQNEFISPNVLPQVPCLAHQRLSFNLVSSSFPIASKNNRSCLIKVYDDEIAKKLCVNDIIQVEGRLEPSDPNEDRQSVDIDQQNAQDTSGNSIARRHISTVQSGIEIDPMEGSFEPNLNFPTKLVPRIHVTKITHLSHINPLIFQNSDILGKEEKINSQLIRARLSTILAQLFGGDSLAAEYLILSLISGVHKRKDVTTLGQLTVGISGVKPEMEFLIKKVYDIIKRITTHSHYIEMSIKNLNNLTFTPRKDHENNKLLAGTLQLASGCYVLINETALSEGTLNAHGVENITALSDIIKWQRHQYNFQFHQVEIDTDIKILVMSEGKSLLPIECSVKLAHTKSNEIELMSQACASVDDFMTDDLLNKLRYYITFTKQLSNHYEIPEDVQKSVETDFVEWRKRQAESSSTSSTEEITASNSNRVFSAEDLSFYLTLARYLTLSRGETMLTRKIWKEVCEMERERTSRLRKSEESTTQ